MTQQLNNPEWLDQVRRDFVVDAWLSNRDVFGLNYDNVLTDAEGTPWRIDNGGALMYRAMGAKKTDFTGKVGELDVFRTGKKAKVFGPEMTKDQELDGATRVLAITPGDIDDMVADAGLPKSLADTLKARRKYIADYYGLPLPESVKPADTDLGATTAPLVDPADLSTSKGKSRDWFPMSLSSAGFLAGTGDKFAMPGEDKTQVYGVDADGNILSTVGRQNQLNEWLHKYGADAQVMFAKNDKVGQPPRPAHGDMISAAGIASLKWQRGDRLVAENGTEFKVLGVNENTGGVLLQEAVPDGLDPKPAFLFDSYATKPTHHNFAVKRWDPPVPKAADEPPPAVEPAKPSGMAVPAAEEIKADLVTPLPTGTGTPEPAKVEVDTGKGMLLGDGTKANPGDTVTSKFGGEYVFVKKKGPYAVVTDPTAEDPEKELLKKANTLGQPGKEKSGDVKVPTSVNGKIPAVGMHAVAKDGHEGEITMVSPDGKFVFITNAAGLKKRKSVGTVTIKNGESPIPKPLEDKPADTSYGVSEAQLVDEMAQALAESAPTAVPATSTDAVDISESKQLKDYPDLKVGDKISKDGKTWSTVTNAGNLFVVTDDGKTWSTSGAAWSVDPVLTSPVPAAPESVDLDLPGGYLLTPQEAAIKVAMPAPNPPQYFVEGPDGEGWIQLGDQGPDLSGSYELADLFDLGTPEVINGYADFATVPKPQNLSGPAFLDLKPGDSWIDNGKSVTVTAWPLNGMVAAVDADGNVFPVYQSAFKPDAKTKVTPDVGFVMNPEVSDKVNAVYDNAWLTKDADNLAKVKGNAALSYLAMEQGIDPNGEVWLHYDGTDESFWDLSGDVAQKWDKDSHTWNPEPNTPGQSKKPDIKNDLPDAEPAAKHVWTGEDGFNHVAVETAPGSDEWVLDGDPWSTYSLEELVDLGVDPELDGPSPDPLADPAVNFGGYSPHPGEQVMKLSNAYDGQSVETWWVQKPAEPGVWYGVIGKDGALHDQHPMNDSDVGKLTTGTDNWTSEIVYGAPLPPDDKKLPVVLQLDGGAGYAPADDETVIQLDQGSYLSSNNGLDWYEIDSDSGQLLTETSWHPGDFEDEKPTVLHQGTPPSSEPFTPTTPEPVGPATAPAADNLLPAGTDLPGGYPPAPGSSVKHVSDGEGLDLWFAQNADGGWQMIQQDGSLANYSGYDDADWAYWTNAGATMEDFVAPGETAGPPAPGQFGGYTTDPGDVVVKIPTTGGAYENTFWVKKSGEDYWHKVTPDGTLSNNEKTTDDSIKWGLNGGVANTEIVHGDFGGSGPAVTPPATTIGGATGAIPVDIDSWSTAGGPLVSDTATAFKAMGELPEGFTPYVFESTLKTWGHAYLKSNTDKWYTVEEDGSVVATMDPAMAGIAVDKVQIGAPSGPPTQAPGGVPLKITGWEQYDLPDPATMSKMDPDATVVVPAEGQWAFVKTSATGGFYAKMKPGTYEPGKTIPFDKISSVGSSTGGGEGTGAPSDWSLPGGLDLNSTDWSFWAVPSGGAGPANGPSAPTDISTKAVPKPVPPVVPTYPGEKLPGPLEIESWGGDLTKDGHIPQIGMFVKRGSMSGAKILSYNADKTKVTVLTKDGKKSLRQISLLQVDAAANYQEYAPKAPVVDVPEGVPIAIDPPGEALKKTLADGKWRPITINTKGIRGGTVLVTSTSTPSGKKVARVQLTLTNAQRESLLAKLAVGGTGPVAKGDWAASSKPSGQVAPGDKIPMRKSSTDNPDGTPRWKVDPDVKPPTHEVVLVVPGPNGTLQVTMKDLASGAQIKSNFHTDKTLTTYQWDPDKIKPTPPSANWIGAIAQNQGWAKTDVGDHVLSKIEGGTVNGKLSVEPGKPVPSSSAAIGWKNGQGGARKINPDGSIIEILGLKTTGTDSANGTVVITLPSNLDEKALNSALADLALDPTPMTQESGKHAARGILKNLMSLDYSDPDGVPPGWSDEKLFTEAGKLLGISDLGWQDVLVGSGEDGKVSYYWSGRAQTAIAQKQKFSLVVRGGTHASAANLASQLMFGQANGVLKRTAGMQGGGGVSASTDAGNNAAHGSYSSALAPSGLVSGGLPSSNPLFSKGSGFMVYINPMAVLGRIQDWRTGPTQGDAFGQGPNYHKGEAYGGNSLKGALTQQQSQDFWLGGGFGPETIGYMAVNKESDRTAAIAELKKHGITMVAGRRTYRRR
jgi:hypothetical protein